MNEERLQKVIARSGVASRRKAEQLILDGKVVVNGKKVTELGTKVTSKDEISVEGIPIEKEKLVYYVLYKPRGVISSVKDESNRKIVLDYLPEIEERIYPVGRLDYDTSGLLLLTNDGDFTNQLLHPSRRINKEYVVKTKGIPDKRGLELFKKGIRSEGETLKAVYVKIKSVDRKKNTAIVKLTLHQGKNRQVRRMFDAIHTPVMKLKREKFGFLTLEGLQPGEYRELTPQEVADLLNLAK
ncbi:23S rRNA pseudouridine2605 synthase [Gracilibacillus halotolerans]|uniref:Pseudouridine synthase n=1 Tax=Gracilibacillus halotolerans TaxID=74386 RepID=A0A841RLU0_9BACI|nr:pseudouridine synthase [Gracilibacillus halotolerans]MBB6511688.1 23S rRNA pseudouridine2605 synthase [Gracilibacillus halotolerans]